MTTSARANPRLATAAGGSGDGGDGGDISNLLRNSPKLREAIRALQLSRLELIAQIRAELEQNDP